MMKHIGAGVLAKPQASRTKLPTGKCFFVKLLKKIFGFDKALDRNTLPTAYGI